MLTETERTFFDLNGFVLLKGLINSDQLASIKEVAARMKRASPYHRRDSESQTVLFSPACYDRKVFDLAFGADLRLRAEQIIGGRSRLEESALLLFSPQYTPNGTGGGLRWHRGITPDYGAFLSNGHYHCLFAKMIIYITDRGPLTGTWVVPGSHKSAISISDFERSAEDRMAHYVDGEPGDVLLFGETLIHSSPPKAPLHERLLLIIAYCAPFMQTWSEETDPPKQLPFAVDDEERKFIYGEYRYSFRSV